MVKAKVCLSNSSRRELKTEADKWLHETRQELRIWSKAFDSEGTMYNTNLLLLFEHRYFVSGLISTIISLILLTLCVIIWRGVIMTKASEFSDKVFATVVFVIIASVIIIAPLRYGLDYMVNNKYYAVHELMEVHYDQPSHCRSNKNFGK